MGTIRTLLQHLLAICLIMTLLEEMMKMMKMRVCLSMTDLGAYCLLSERQVVLTILDSSLPTNIISQLRKIIHAIQSSPQCKQSWLKEVASHSKLNMDGPQQLLILILDVKT